MRASLLLLLLALPAGAETTVTILHFSDYHSHALPFHTDQGERGGIARAVAYLRKEKRAGALVFNGGDTINKGAPPWSDKYQCAEWPWLNGIVDAMAFGNHDVDYGREAFERCAAAVKYPILSANTEGFRGHATFDVRGVRIGVFALAGKDFARLVQVPLEYRDPIAVAREAVRVLRDEQGADAVVMIGHQLVEDDYALAREVPGIDVIFGSHSHLERDLTQIPGTGTVYISPSQYLTHISRVELTVGDEGVRNVRGSLVRVDASMPEDRTIARRVRKMQRDLERDPRYRALFVPIGRLDTPLSTGEVAKATVAIMREATSADIAIATKSTFRGAMPAGVITLEMLHGVLPYENEVIVCSMSGEQAGRLLEVAGEKSYVAGSVAQRDRSYRVAATDYMTDIAYRDAFECDKEKAGITIRQAFSKVLKK